VLTCRVIDRGFDLPLDQTKDHKIWIVFVLLLRKANNISKNKDLLALSQECSFD